MSPADKRDLAVMMAERAAPQLVPKIQAETGLDLTGEQVQAVIDMAGRVRAARHPLVEFLRDQTTVVDAVPDGWARRRTLQAMLGAQVLPTVDDLLDPRAAARLRGRYR